MLRHPLVVREGCTRLNFIAGKESPRVALEAARADIPSRCQPHTLSILPPKAAAKWLGQAKLVWTVSMGLLWLFFSQIHFVGGCGLHPLPLVSAFVFAKG